MKSALLLVALCALLVPAAATGAAIATVKVGSDPLMSIPLTQDGNTFLAIDEMLSGTGWTLDIDLTLNGSPSVYGGNPFITYGIAATNTSGGALSFSFVLSLDSVSGNNNAPGQVASSISGSFTDGGDGSLTVTPLSAPQGADPDGNNGTEIAVFHLSTNGGATPANAGIDVGAALAGAGGSGSYPAENQGPIAGPSGSGLYDWMRVDLNFSLSGDATPSSNGEIFTFDGSAAVIPEPATAALFGLGLLGIAFVGRRRL